MGLGSILGSISPLFGMASGKGLFGHLPLKQLGQSGVGGLLGMLLAGGDGGGDASAPAPAAPAPAAAPTGPTPNGGVAGKVGLAMMQGGGDGGAPMGFSEMPQQQHSGLLQSLLADQPQPAMGVGGGNGLQALLMRLGLLR